MDVLIRSIRGTINFYFHRHSLEYHQVFGRYVVCNMCAVCDVMVFTVVQIDLTAASDCSTEPPYLKASKVLDMAVCCHPPSVFCVDDYITTTWAVSNLVELDIHHHSQHFCFVGLVFSGGLLPRVCKRIGTTQTASEVPVHQGNCFLLLLAGKLLYFILTG